MSSHNIDQILQNNLTSEQYAASTDTAKEVLCLACAGSGKSRTLAFRIARLIAEGNPPESIVAFTFTEKAADSIKRRVAEALDKAGLSIAIVGAMYIGTTHSYCKALLGEINAKYRQFEVLDDNGLKLFLLSRYYELGLHTLKESRASKQFETIKQVSQAWKLVNDEVIDFARVSTHDPILGNTLQTIYSRLVHDQFIDFSLMVRLVVDAINNNSPAIDRALAPVKHLMVDEYQDVNPAQEFLIRGMNQRIDTLFVVGDDDQSIYGWRGADVQNIIDFTQRYPNCSTHTLSTNFRSTEAIVKTADLFIQTELATSRIPKSPTFHSNGNVRHFGNLWFNTREDEAEWIANRINELLGTEYWEDEQGNNRRGLTKSDFAILMRSVKGQNPPPYHRDFTNALEDIGLEYMVEAEGSIFQRPHSEILRRSMELLRNPGITRTEGQQFFNQWVVPHFPNGDLNKFLLVLYSWNRQIHVPAGGSRVKVYPQKLVHDLLNSFGVPNTTFPTHDAVMRDLGIFSSIIKDVEKVYISIDRTERYREILNFLGNAADTYDASAVELLARPDAITVSTVHKMKGLEFPVVFVVDVVNDRFPGRRRNYDGWLPSEIMGPILAKELYVTSHKAEARLFYTAITRAERMLYVTGSSIHPGLKTLKKPSNFKLRLQFPEITTQANDLPTPLNRLPEKRRIDDNSMPTSFTEIKDYLECPMKYKYRKLYGFNPAVPELFGFGLTTHTAINKIHQDYVSTPPSRIEAEDALTEVFHLKHVFPSKNPTAKGPFENARDKAKKIIGDYVEDYSADFLLSRRMEYRFEIKAGRALITGSIDLLLRLDNADRILEATVIDFKTMDLQGSESPSFWINMALQVQLYSYAANEVLGENAKTGAVHLLKEKNTPNQSNRIQIPISDEAIQNALNNIEWAVEQILQRDFPMRPSQTKCSDCDFNLICSKSPEQFANSIVPPHVHIPETGGIDSISVGAFSDFQER